MELFGFEIKRKNEELPSFVEKTEDDGAVNVSVSGGAYGTYVDLEGTAKTEAELVTKYRSMEQHHEVQNQILFSFVWALQQKKMEMQPT